MAPLAHGAAVLAALPAPVLLVGGYGYENVGDEAMLAGFATILGRDRMTVVSRRPDRTRELHGVRAVGLRGAPLALLRHRTLVIGGGALFGRDMGALGRLLPVVGIAARLLGRNVALAGITADHDTPRLARPMLAALGRLASTVLVRDRASVAFFARLGVRATYAPDPSELAERACPDAGRAVLAAAGLSLRRPVVGLALTSVEPALAARVEAALPAWLAAVPDADVVLLPTSRHPFVPGHDDLVFARRLMAANPRLHVVEGPLDPGTMLAAIGELAVLVAMRYHAHLFAERLGTPLVSLPYAPKCAAWCADHGIDPATVETVAARLRVALDAIA